MKYRGTSEEIEAARINVLALEQELKNDNERAQITQLRLFNAINKLASLCSTEDTK